MSFNETVDVPTVKGECSKETYLSAFGSYVNSYFKKWLDLEHPGDLPSDFVLDRIARGADENARVLVLKYVLPYANGRDDAVGELAFLKMVHAMRISPLRFNDETLHEFCEVLLEGVDGRSLLREPLHEDYAEVQKFLWNFIIAFKKAHRIPLLADEGR